MVNGTGVIKYESKTTGAAMIAFKEGVLRKKTKTVIE